MEEAIKLTFQRKKIDQDSWTMEETSRIDTKDSEALIRIALTESMDPRFHSPELMEEAIKLTFQSKKIDQDSWSDKLRNLRELYGEDFVIDCYKDLRCIFISFTVGTLIGISLKSQHCETLIEKTSNVFGTNGLLHWLQCQGKERKEFACQYDLKKKIIKLLIEENADLLDSYWR